jgi:methyl-accepting chemotaxis protein
MASGTSPLDKNAPPDMTTSAVASHVHASSNTHDRAGFFAHHGFWAPGVRLFRAMNFAAKATILSLAFVIPLMSLIGWLVHTQYSEAMSARMEATRQHVEVAHGIVQWAQAQATSGAVSGDQARKMALDALSTLRYDGQQYFWVNDMQAHMVMHPIKPELNGKDLSSTKDPNGFALFQAFVDVVRKDGQGFVAYQWPKPGQDGAVDKISYVQGFAPWGWVIGSGAYVDDIRNALIRELAWGCGIVGMVLLVALYLFLSFYRVMDGGLKETRRHLRAITDGDLTTSPSPWGKDEAADLMLELRTMQHSLRTMVLRVRQASTEIVHSSSEIASGAMDLSSRTEQAAASLEETAASMEEIASTVKSTADHSGEASQVAAHNAETALEGGRVMGDVVNTMDLIRTSSAKIGEIIATIDGIAFQTNILALNAAVEAARAGEQGRGFAVVASEVRTLAQRSAGAAREIKTILVRSVEEVETGAGIVRQAGQTIQDIVSSSQRVNQLLGEVATGAREQNQGIEQIGMAVHELDQTTQQNAALVEQTAAAAAAMKEQAHTLADEVARFKVPAHVKLDATPPPTDARAFDFDQAIEAHRHWKVKLRQAIAEHQHLDADKICRDDQCPLGQWVHGPGGTLWGTRPTFVELLKKHAQFHQSAGEVARTINARQYDSAERLIGSGSVFSNVSNEVTTLLTRAKRGL